uniref:Uncharacterized protein n=1 Tax=Nothobranchius furzeri TaxID=105023 RepID=A0A8C6LQI7_NOTFU
MSSALQHFPGNGEVSKENVSLVEAALERAVLASGPVTETQITFSLCFKHTHISTRSVTHSNLSI